MPGIQGVSIAGVYATRQAHDIGRSALEASLEAIMGALSDAGMELAQIDGIAGRWPGPGGTVMHPGSADWAGFLGLPLRWLQDTYPQGVPATLDAAAAIMAGLCETVLIVGGQAAIRGNKNSVAEYTRPQNEFVSPWGAFTAVHFALVAQRQLERNRLYRRAAAEVAAIVRNRGDANPEAVMYGKGPYSHTDIVDSPVVATPFHRLDLCLANEGAAALIITRTDLVENRSRSVEIVSGGSEWMRQQYVTPARHDQVWNIGRKSAVAAFKSAGIKPADIDVALLYDVNSFEILRQLEVLGFCETDFAPQFVRDRGISADGVLPVNPDGGLLSYSHIGWGGPTLKVVEAVHHLRNEAGARQVKNARYAVVTGAGSGAQYYNLMILKAEG